MASRNSKGRMLHWKISNCKQLSRCSHIAQLLFTWGIPNTDDLGRMEGDAEILKGVIFPFDKKITEKNIISALEELSAEGLISWYKVGENWYIQYPNFDTYQKLRKDKKRISDYPSPPEFDDELVLSEKDIELLICDEIHNTGKFCGIDVFHLENQMRVQESYLDIVIDTCHGKIIIELKKCKLTNKALIQILKYMKLINCNSGVLLGYGLSAELNIEDCKKSNIAIIEFNDDYQFSLLSPNKEIDSLCDFVIESREITVNKKLREVKRSEVKRSEGEVKRRRSEEKGYSEFFEKAYKIYPRSQAKQDTCNNWNKLLKTYTEEQLYQFALNYSEFYKSIPENDKGYPYSSNNFYGQKAYYKDFLEPKTWKGQIQKSSNPFLDKARELQNEQD